MPDNEDSEKELEFEEKIYRWTHGIRDGQFVTWDDTRIDGTNNA